MQRIRIECELPFMLALEDGMYSDSRPEPLQWQEIELPDSDELGRTRVGCCFNSEAASLKEIEAEKAKQARNLIFRVNRLIRWYRVISSDRAAVEVTLSKASPFLFYVDSTHALWGKSLIITPPPIVEPGFQKYSASFPQLSENIRTAFFAGSEPPVADLFLMDARQSLDEGRFREAVLFSWSTIDATFSSQFDLLVDGALADEWSESRKFLKGLDFGLRHRMTIGMRLVAGRSFFKEPGEFWPRLSASYDRRNNIIHRGETASEFDAENAIRVAQEVVELMKQTTARANLTS